MADSNKFKGGSNPHHGAPISQSGHQQYGQGPKPGQQGGGAPSYGAPSGPRPSQAELRRQGMTHGGSQKKGR